MNIEALVSTVYQAAESNGYFKEGAVGSNGYGFVFKDLNSNIPYVTFRGSSKVFGAGSHRDVTENFRKLRKLKKIRSFDELYTINPKYDLLLAGSVKTLVPTLKFGGSEILFNVWMFVKTPEDKLFPARFYYGQSGPSIGAWKSTSERHIDRYTRENVFPEDFEKIINFSPFDFTDNERNLFLDALEFALEKVPVSNFWGIYSHDLGNSLMGVEKSKPFNRELGFFEGNPKAEKKIEPFLGRSFETVHGIPFTVYLVPNISAYVIHFNYGGDKSHFSREDLWFQGAKETLEHIEGLQKDPF